MTFVKYAIVTILLLSFSLAFISCSQPEAEVFDLVLTQNNEISLSGYDCVILQHTESDSSGTQIAEDNPFGYVATSVFADDILKRISDIENETECTISIDTISTTSNMLVASGVSGINLGEILFSASRSITNSVACMGTIVPLQYFDIIDLNDHDKWGGTNVYEINSVDGDIYGVCPMYWLFKQPRSISILAVNNLIAKRYGLYDLREYVENGEWTWDTFEKTLIDYTVKDGELTYYALACRFFDFVKLSVFGNGCKMARLDENGNVVSDLESEAAMDAYTWCRKIATDYKSCLEYGTSDNNWPDTTESFIEERSLMMLTAPSVIYTSLVYENSDFATIPFPIGPDGTYGEWPSALEAAECFSIFAMAHDQESAAHVINALCEPMESFPTHADMVEYLGANVLFGDKDAEIMLSTHEFGSYTYWNDTDIDTFWRAFQDGQLESGMPSNIVAANINYINEIIEEKIKPNLTLYTEFGS